VIVFWLCAFPSCAEVVKIEREVVDSSCKVAIPQWRSLYGRSCVDIVKILLYEGREVEQWLEPRNISCCLRLIYYFLTLSLLYLALLYIAHIHMLDIIVCLYLC